MRVRRGATGTDSARPATASTTPGRRSSSTSTTARTQAAKATTSGPAPTDTRSDGGSVTPATARPSTVHGRSSSPGRLPPGITSTTAASRSGERSSITPAPPPAGGGSSAHEPKTRQGGHDRHRSIELGQVCHLAGGHVLDQAGHLEPSHHLHEVAPLRRRRADARHLGQRTAVEAGPQHHGGRAEGVHRAVVGVAQHRCPEDLGVPNVRRPPQAGLRVDGLERDGHGVESARTEATIWWNLRRERGLGELLGVRLQLRAGPVGRRRPVERPPQRRGVGGGEQQSGHPVDDRLAEPAGVDGDDRRAEAHRLERREPEVLLRGRDRARRRWRRATAAARR